MDGKIFKKINRLALQLSPGTECTHSFYCPRHKRGQSAKENESLPARKMTFRTKGAVK